jgi:hypothetical protein
MVIFAKKQKAQEGRGMNRALLEHNAFEREA